MRSLLELAGFQLRGNRADCLHCEGRSRWTISFNSEVCFCHRCHFKANVITLARELGLFDNPELRERFLREAGERKRQNAEMQRFDAWRDASIRQVSARHRSLWRNAGLAQEVLKKYPDCEPAWDALARWHHAEAQLCATLDYLTFAKASIWLEVDSTREELLQVWRESVRAA
jgi:hypothetical protein